jgi:hypothetical protein
MRGVGNSQGSLDRISLHHLAADVAGVIEGLECAPAYVLATRSGTASHAVWPQTVRPWSGR